MATRKKSKYKHCVINKEKYYFYFIEWKDILGDSGHCNSDEFDKMTSAVMHTHAYIYDKGSKEVKTFASYDANEEVFSDRNVIPRGCIVKMKRLEI